jgi:hypothetical protein
MAPILGIYASQISGHLFAPSGAYDSIATTTVGSGGASSIDFTSIPSTYTHLQLRWILRTSRTSATADGVFFRFNADSGSNYRTHSLGGDGSSAYAGASGSATGSPQIAPAPSSTATASVFSAGVFDILDYANTSKNKTIRNLTGFDANGSGYIELDSAVWLSTTAVNQLTIYPVVGPNFLQYSSFALYGIKGGN